MICTLNSSPVRYNKSSLNTAGFSFGIESGHCCCVKRWSIWLIFRYPVGFLKSAYFKCWNHNLCTGAIWIIPIEGKKEWRPAEETASALRSCHSGRAHWRGLTGWAACTAEFLCGQREPKSRNYTCAYRSAHWTSLALWTHFPSLLSGQETSVRIEMDSVTCKALRVIIA